MKNYTAENISPFDLALTLECGQAFRWRNTEDGAFEGVAKGKYLKIRQEGKTLIFYDTTEDEFKNIWFDYFDLGRDYSEIINRTACDKRLAPMTKLGGGIRILRQDPWEALCSFIISQNNNIPRIKGIIERLCQCFGDKIKGGYTFPSPQKLAELSVDDLAPLKSGFRAKYILDAAKKCSENLNLDEIKSADFFSAKEALMTINGVGPKVADCTLLYGMGFTQAFPMDVWMKRAMKIFFNDEFPQELNDCAGIIQQYIFHYARTEKISV